MFTGGKLSFKGGVGPAVKKKGKKKSKKKIHAAEATEAAEGVEKDDHVEAPDAVKQQGQKQDDAADTRTEAEKRRETHMAKYEQERAKKAASKSHRQRIAEMNKYLEGLSEHHDIPKTSYSYM